ncbi:hypothetical protein [Glutamicibacter arilaitensis]|uniref:hypothetical protein n=1 Tax=Glutamicibacter arilaitensis TaxID=256701 RepID=UPI003FD15FF3
MATITMDRSGMNLRQALLQALQESSSDHELAGIIVDSGLLKAIFSQATCTEAEVRERLNYSTPDAVRAAISKARAGKGNFPLPVMEGRHWSVSSVDQYRESSQRAKR